MEILVSICITSYNRVEELLRTLNSIDVEKYASNIEVIVSEDKSPKREQIYLVFKEWQSKVKYKTLFNSNEENLGYDRNLGKLCQLANGKWIIYMSDDDTFVCNSIDSYIEKLIKKDPALAFTPFVGQGYNRKHSHDYHINSKTEQHLAKHLNDAILFSGLTFKKEAIMNIDSNRFLNSYYFQVYLFLNTMYRYGADYIDLYLIDCTGGGANGFGLNDSGVKNELIANRQSPLSILAFHKGLYSVVNIFDIENGTKIKDLHSHEYTIRQLPHMCRARLAGKETYKKYLAMLDDIGIKLTWEFKVYKICIRYLGAKISLGLFSIPRRLLLFLKKHKIEI